MILKHLKAFHRRWQKPQSYWMKGSTNKIRNINSGQSLILYSLCRLIWTENTRKFCSNYTTIRIFIKPFALTWMFRGSVQIWPDVHLTRVYIKQCWLVIPQLNLICCLMIQCKCVMQYLAVLLLFPKKGQSWGIGVICCFQLKILWMGLNVSKSHVMKWSHQLTWDPSQSTRWYC